MILKDLKSDIESHSGTFLCGRINSRDQTKVVHFAHVVGEPAPAADVPSIGRLRDFLDTFGSVIFYVDRLTGEAAKHIAPPSEWANLDSDFRDWIEDLDEDERADIVPDWIDDCLVIGEEPRTGNYILMPVSGDDAGAVYLFDHDGFEFTREADDLIHYVQRMLSPDDRLLTNIAAHMRFVEDDHHDSVVDPKATRQPRQHGKHYRIACSCAGSGLARGLTLRSTRQPTA